MHPSADNFWVLAKGIQALVLSSLLSVFRRVITLRLSCRLNEPSLTERKVLVPTRYPPSDFPFIVAAGEYEYDLAAKNNLI